jgi:predicted TPR repeat methyltransferase
LGNIAKFEQIAGQYDTTERIEVAGIAAESIRGRIENGSGKLAVDYGCGTGLVGLQLLDVFEKVLFVDASENMIRQVQRKIMESGVNNAEALRFDIMSGDTCQFKADFIFLVQVLLHENDIVVLLAGLFSSLNAGGRLFIVDFETNDRVNSPDVHNGFDRGELSALLRELSFSVYGYDVIYRGKSLFMGQDAALFIMETVK